jgi:hypothetical protein
VVRCGGLSADDRIVTLLDPLTTEKLAFRDVGGTGRSTCRWPASVFGRFVLAGPRGTRKKGGDVFFITSLQS